MHVPAWPVLPSSTLAQNQIAEKFAVPSLMGIGSFCDDNPDECGMSSGSAPVDLCTLYPSSCGSTPNPFPDFTPGPGQSVDQFGNIIYSSVPSIPATPTGTAVNVPTSNGTVTYVNRGTQQQPNYQPVIGAAVQGAIDIAKLLTITAGTVQQGGTTLKQNPGFAVPLPATNTGVNLKANTGSSLIIAAAVVGVAALFLLKGKN